MGTLDEESTKADDQLAKKAIPCEIIEDILSRLPVKSILRFRSLSKPWLSRISHPSFTKLYFTRTTAAHRTALFILAYDHFSRKHHLLSAAHDGGPVTHLITVDESYPGSVAKAEHLNGLVLFTCVKSLLDHYYTHVVVVNPSTRKIFELPDSYPEEEVHTEYFFGFDESRNEHKILNFRYFYNPTRYEIMIFSLSDYSWRKIGEELPIGFSFECIDSVCVNSVIHMMLLSSYDILAFDLRTENFSIINTPRDIVPHESITDYGDNAKDNNPLIIKVNGCIGVVCHDRVVESNGMHIWILQDYENRVWVEETITFAEPWEERNLGCPFPVDAVNMDEIIFSGNLLSVYVYKRKSRCLESFQFTPGHQFLLSSTIYCDHIRCYVESMMSL